MRRLLCAAGVALALALSGAGVAFADTPGVPTDQHNCDLARDAVTKAQNNVDRINARINANPNAPTSAADRTLRDQLEGDLKSAQAAERSACGRVDGHGPVGGPVNLPGADCPGDRFPNLSGCQRNGNPPVGLPRFVDHGNTIVIGNVTVDFDTFATVEALRASALYLNAAADVRVAIDDALRVKAFNLRHRGGVFCPLDHNPGAPGCQNSGPIVAGGFHDRFDGRFVVIDGGPRLDVCDSDNYGVFRGRHGVYGNRLDALFGNNHDGRFGDLHRSCTVANTTVVNNGDCQTVITDVDNYRRSVDHWNDLSHRFNTPDLVRSHRGELDSAWRDHLRFRDSFNSLRPRVTTTCAAPTTINNIVVQPAPVSYVLPSPAAPVTVTTTASPAPASADNGGGQVSQVPTGSVNTGWVA